MGRAGRISTTALRIQIQHENRLASDGDSDLYETRGPDSLPERICGEGPENDEALPIR